MPTTDKLLAWIEPRDQNEFEAAFVAGATASKRAPASRRFTSPEAAKQWLELQAAEFGVVIEWANRPGYRLPN